jgi:ABC-type transport system involved in multi-copper enzyme maturation permease subunit
MFALPSLSLLWAQGGAPSLPLWLIKTFGWLVVWGDPSYTDARWFGAPITFLKIVGLFSLLGWIAGWAIGARRDRNVPKAPWLDVVGLVSLLGLFVSVTLGVLQATKRIPPIDLHVGLSLPALVGLPFAIGAIAWVERALWVTIGRLGRWTDGLVLGLVHIAMAVGLAVGLLWSYLTFGQLLWAPGIVYGVRVGATYMGLVVLARLTTLVGAEVLAIRPRRLYAIAKLSIVEANRRMWAPWVVLTVFGVILAFTHWFLQPPEQRPAEVGRLYISTLMLLCSLLITVMVSVLSPISLPQDIQSQTIFTVVSKPVRRLELVWGRMLGFMAMVTVLIAVFGGISLLYLYRNVRGTIEDTRAQAAALRGKDDARADQLLEQAEQLRTRMSAREPIKGTLTFLDSRGNPQLKGIDVGQDISEDIEPRSHIEGATPATAIWRYGWVPDPYNPQRLLDRRVPVDQLLRSGTIEALENQALLLEYGADVANQVLAKASEAERSRFAAEVPKATAEASRLHAESQRLQREAADLETKADAAEKAGKIDEAESLRDQAAEKHSPPLQLEMTFTIYRTTKGRVGEPVYAEIEVTNPNPRIVQTPWRDVFPIREYYTNKKVIPASYLVGSNGELRVEIRCISPTQYLGMGESDLFILKDKGNFGLNFAMGLAGIWLQAMVLTAIGVFAGTFLSWPMALLTTVAFYVAGQVAFSFFAAIAYQSLQGGGPAESLIRLVTHDNQMTDLTPTLAVVVAKTFDALVMPVLTRLAYIVPNFGALDVSNTVAEGFAVTWPTMLGNALLALAYALPFSIAGYFILKNREVAA